MGSDLVPIMVAAGDRMDATAATILTAAAQFQRGQALQDSLVPEHLLCQYFGSASKSHAASVQGTRGSPGM